VPELIILVLDDGSKLPDVLDAWLELGVSGVTLLDSTGLGHQVRDHVPRDDLPLLPSLAHLLRPREDPSRTLFSVVPDGFDVDTLIAATERVTGDLDEANTGILFTVTVERAKGLNRR
jgi:nitrogen regulatory protein P-II 1